MLSYLYEFPCPRAKEAESTAGSWETDINDCLSEEIDGVMTIL